MKLINVFFGLPKREYILIVLVVFALAIDFLYPGFAMLLTAISLVGSIPTIYAGIGSLFYKRISIDTFNCFALVVSFAAREIRSAAFIVLMLSFARLLDWYTESRTKDAVSELLKLKPLTAIRDEGELIEVPIEEVKINDILVIKEGSRVPVDGVVVWGGGFLDEASISGESIPTEKIIQDKVVSGTLLVSGALKIKAERVGEDSTIERMAALMREASKHKSKSEKLADRFAGIFLPVVGALGILVYLWTKNISMTAALFLVACADDMAVAIPLAMTAALGEAARRGVIIKGGEWLNTLSNVKTLVLDKTGTLTYGTLSLRNYHIEPAVREKDFWRFVGIAEKFSEHPIGRAVYHEARKKTDEIPDPDEFKVYKGSGVWAKYQNHEIVVGSESILKDLNVSLGASIAEKIQKEKSKFEQTSFLVFIDQVFYGLITVADTPRKEAGESIQRIKELGVSRIIMMTGDNEAVAKNVSVSLNISEFRAGMVPEAKLREIETLLREGPLAMVGDGINDAPALARSDVGIAMGGAGAGVAVQAADIVILTDNLSRLPEMILLGRKTFSVVRWDVVIWIISNLVGFALVLTGIAGPALAAFYNFATDFLPLFNSARLFRRNKG